LKNARQNERGALSALVADLEAAVVVVVLEWWSRGTVAVMIVLKTKTTG
jgi:hypothetical protein